MEGTLLGEGWAKAQEPESLKHVWEISITVAEHRVGLIKWAWGARGRTGYFYSQADRELWKVEWSGLMNFIFPKVWTMSSGGCRVEGGGLLRGCYTGPGSRGGRDINSPSCLYVLEPFISSKCLLLPRFSIHVPLGYTLLLCYLKIQNK